MSADECAYQIGLMIIENELNPAEVLRMARDNIRETMKSHLKQIIADANETRGMLEDLKKL